MSAFGGIADIGAWLLYPQKRTLLTRRGMSALCQKQTYDLECAININLRRFRMSDTSQIALIRKLYDARGNVNIFKSLLADDLEYDIVVGFPNGASIAVSTRLLMISSHSWPTS